MSSPPFLNAPTDSQRQSPSKTVIDQGGHKKEHLILPSDVVPQPLGFYSHVVKAGGFVYLCGIGSRSPQTGKEVGLLLDERNQVVSYDITEQARQAFENLKNTLEAVDCQLEDLVDVMVLLKDMRDFLKYNQVYNEFFCFDPLPTRTTFEGSPPGNSYIQIKAVAYKP